VVARVKKILRRATSTPAGVDEERLSYRGITLHPERFQCTVGEQQIELTPIEFRLLQALISRPGHVFSRDRLMSLGYTDGRIVSDRTIDTHIKNLRKKLLPATQDEDLLHSIYGVGYKID
jgi:two-component system response regulator BaeR